MDNNSSLLKKSKAHENGNDAFRKKDYVSAISYYRKAKLNDTNIAILYSNIAQCYLKMEHFGYAFFYATKALEFNYLSMKSFYRLCQSIINMNGPGRISLILSLKKDYDKKKGFTEAFTKDISCLELFDQISQYISSDKYENEVEEYKKHLSNSPNPDFLANHILINFDYKFPPMKIGNLPLLEEYIQSLNLQNSVAIEYCNFGRKMVAKRNYKPEDLIFSESALLSVSILDNSCFHCTKIIESDDCPTNCINCDTQYCSKECYDIATCYHFCEKGWSKSINNCRKAKTSSARIILLLSKLVSIISTGTLDIPYIKHVIRYISALSFGSIDKINEMKLGISLFNEENRLNMVMDTLNPPRSKYLFFDYTCYKELERLLIINSFAYQCNEDPYSYLYGNGSGLYLLASMINHSCLPNAEPIWCQEKHGSMVFLKASKNIQKGEEINISYIPNPINNKEKKDYLNTIYGFDCACPSCV